MKYSDEVIKRIIELLPQHDSNKAIARIIKPEFKLEPRLDTIRKKVEAVRGGKIPAKSAYTNEIREFAKVRMEQTPNDTQIARDIVNKFGLDKTVNAVRKYVQDRRETLKIRAKELPIKRLFVDIETGYYKVMLKTFSLKLRSRFINHSNIIENAKIICISYKWQYEDKVHTLDYRMGERNMLKEFIKIMEQAGEIVGHNSDNFDMKMIRTRALFHGALMFPNYRTLDTYKKAKHFFRFPSNSLDYIANFMDVGGKLKNMRFEDWEAIVEDNDEKTLEKMIKYCEHDVTITEDVFHVMSPFIDHNNNFAVLSGGEKWECPNCTSGKVKMFRTYTTAMGIIRREMKCDQCKKQYRVSNKTYMSMLTFLNSK